MNAKRANAGIKKPRTPLKQFSDKRLARLQSEGRFQQGSTFAAAKPQQAKSLKTRDTGPDRKTRALVYIRDGNCCVCCGTPVQGRPHSIGHRMRRSQGGSNRPSNLLTFLGLGSNPFDPDDHHARIDSRKNPGDETHGYSVRSNRDPLLIGVQYFERPGGSGTTRWLLDDGDWLNEPPDGAA